MLWKKKRGGGKRERRECNETNNYHTPNKEIVRGWSYGGKKDANRVKDVLYVFPMMSQIIIKLV